MADTIMSGLSGGCGIFCGGERETQRRARQIVRGQLSPVWKGRQAMKSWTHIERAVKARQARKSTPARSGEAVVKPSRNVATAASTLGAVATMATKRSMGGGGR